MFEYGTTDHAEIVRWFYFVLTFIYPSFDSSRYVRSFDNFSIFYNACKISEIIIFSRALCCDPPRLKLYALCKKELRAKGRFKIIDCFLGYRTSFNGSSWISQRARAICNETSTMYGNCLNNSTPDKDLMYVDRARFIIHWGIKKTDDFISMKNQRIKIDNFLIEIYFFIGHTIFALVSNSIITFVNNSCLL